MNLYYLNGGKKQKSKLYLSFLFLIIAKKAYDNEEIFERFNLPC